MGDAPVLAAEARADLEQLARSILSRPPAPGAAFELALKGLMTAADDYWAAPEELPRPGARFCLDGSSVGRDTACRFEWSEFSEERPRIVLTTDPAKVNCRACRKSRLYREVAGS